MEKFKDMKWKYSSQVHLVQNGQVRKVWYGVSR